MTSASTFLTEILGQPAALLRLVEDYAAEPGRRRLAAVPAAERPVFVGMGASFHAAQIAVQQLASLGIAAQAVEATDALYAPELLRSGQPIVYISQSGASGELGPLLDQLPSRTPVVAVTNNPDSPLAQRAAVVLPLLAGPEETVATKTYLNSLAVLWLLARQWHGRLDPGAFAALRSVQRQLARQLADAPAIADHWLSRFGAADVFVFVGSGLEAVTARQSAMMLLEWLKQPALAYSTGAFRHGPIEVVGPNVGCVLFATPGPAYEATQRLAGELADYGAPVLVVERGTFAGAALAAEPEIPAGLAPLLDVLPVQIFIEAAARQSGLPLGFRHIQKVVTTV
jgi:glutamine---fructose-6-phosphate transaminase (isomerizing)